MQAVAAVLFGRKPVEVRAVAALAEEVQVQDKPLFLLEVLVVQVEEVLMEVLLQ